MDNKREELVTYLGAKVLEDVGDGSWLVISYPSPTLMGWEYRISLRSTPELTSIRLFTGIPIPNILEMKQKLANLGLTEKVSIFAQTLCFRKVVSKIKTTPSELKTILNGMVFDADELIAKINNGHHP